MENKSLIILYSYHHNNTEKIARAIAEVIDARIKLLQDISSEEHDNYNLIGFGSGIDSGSHYNLLLDYVDKLPQISNRNAFIFSTYGAPKIAVNTEFISNNHLKLKGKLQSKGYTIIGEFACAGYNTNGFLKLFGGINKGRPSEDDLKNAEEFAQSLVKK